MEYCILESDLHANKSTGLLMATGFLSWGDEMLWNETVVMVVLVNVLKPTELYILIW